MEKSVYSICVVRKVRTRSYNSRIGNAKMTKMYDLIPVDGRKSFYGKAKVEIEDNGSEVLYSYNTPIIRRNADGTLTRLYKSEPSMTTLRHVRAFCGLNKKGFVELA